jgi:hypothetical protein
MAVLTVVGFVLSSGAAQAQEFSAEIVTHGDKGDHTETQKVFVAGGKMRVESAGAIIVADSEAHTGIMLMANKKAYVEMPGLGGMGRAFVQVDPAHACDAWRALGKRNDGGTCATDGPETVDGRNTVKITGESVDHKKGSAWVDAKLHVVIKVQGDGFGMEIKNIHEGPQPPELFAVPAGYQKMDIQQLMQSDPAAPPPK